MSELSVGLIRHHLLTMAKWCKAREDDDGSGTYIPAYPSGDVHDLLTQAAELIIRAPVKASEARGDDTKRLDWLSADGEDRTVYIAMDERWSAQDGFACYGGDTLREAIDAAMSAHTQAGPVAWAGLVSKWREQSFIGEEELPGIEVGCRMTLGNCADELEAIATYPEQNTALSPREGE